MRGPDGLLASRVQSKSLSEFRRRHPAFAGHWEPGRFGEPWLPDYPAAQPERRPDLDLPRTAIASDLRSPLAFAFYWSRFLAPAGGPVSIVLPSFKHNKTIMLQLSPASAGDGWSRWSTPLHHPGLEATPASLAVAWVSPEHYLLQLGLDVHTDWASGQATLRAQGCQGVLINPG